MITETTELLSNNREISARASLVAISEANLKDKDNAAAMFKHFKAELAVDDDFRDAMERSWFSYNWPSVRQELERKELARLKSGTPKQRAKALKIEERKEKLRDERKAAKEARVASALGVVKSKMVAASKANILGMAMPDGRELGDWRCSDLGRLGGFFSRLSHEAGLLGVPDQTARSVFTERQVQKLHKSG